MVYLYYYILNLFECLQTRVLLVVELRAPTRPLDVRVVLHLELRVQLDGLLKVLQRVYDQVTDECDSVRPVDVELHRFRIDLEESSNFA